MNMRTIRLAYCVRRQAVMAWRIRHEHGCQVPVELLCEVGDRDMDFDLLNKELDPLKAQALSFKTTGLNESGQSFVTDTYYLLHDTPEIRATLERLDYSRVRGLQENINELLKLVRDLGYKSLVFTGNCHDGDHAFVENPNLVVRITK